MQRRLVFAGIILVLQLAAQAAADFSGLAGSELKRVLLELHRNSTVIDTNLLDDPNVKALHGRQLLAADNLQAWAQYEQQGRYVVIKNPQMSDGHSSTGQVAIHSVLLPGTYKVLIAGRNLPRTGPKSIPEPKVGGNVSTVYDVTTGTYVVTPNYETLFCTGHSVMSDGNIVAAGGDIGYISGGKSELKYPWMKEGRDVVRIFYKDTLKWETLPGVKLSEYRWYPTQTNLPDDRVIIVSGFLDDPARQTGKPAPSIDVFDYRTKEIVVRKSRYDLGKKFFTNITPGYQLYPVVFLMPWTDPNKPDDWFLFMYTCRTGQVVRFTSDNEFIPLWNMPGIPIENMCTSFSAMGSAVILPLRPSQNYQFEVAIFGGGTQGKGLDCKGVCNEPAAKTIFRMKMPSAAEALAGKWPKDWQWPTGKAKYEEMEFPRVFADAVLLPNGDVVILNGAQKGVPGGGIEGGGTAKDAAYTALLYDPDKPGGKRLTTLATSGIHRFYHSNALLLPSGDIWVGGSEQADCVDTCASGGLAPPDQEYRAELLQLPYAFKARPEIVGVSSDTVSYGGTITVKYKWSGPITTASVIPPGANTHSLNMMQRVVFLTITARTPNSVTVRFPTAADRVLNPGPYMLWINSDKLPCKEASWITLTAAGRKGQQQKARQHNGQQQRARQQKAARAKAQKQKARKPTPAPQKAHKPKAGIKKQLNKAKGRNRG